MRTRTWLRVVPILLLICLATAQEAPKNDVAERIVGAAMTRGGAMAFLETLTDTVGARVTGSPQSQAAADLILKALKDAVALHPDLLSVQ